MSRFTSAATKTAKVAHPIVRTVGVLSASATLGAAIAVPLAAAPAKTKLQMVTHASGVWALGLAVGDKVGEAIDKQFDAVYDTLDTLEQASEKRKTKKSNDK